jgi:hypothetical protein
VVTVDRDLFGPCHRPVREEGQVVEAAQMSGSLLVARRHQDSGVRLAGQPRVALIEGKDVLATFEQLDFERVWVAATDRERRLLSTNCSKPSRSIQITWRSPCPALRRSTSCSEVGLTDQSDFAGVGGGLELVPEA